MVPVILQVHIFKMSLSKNWLSELKWDRDNSSICSSDFIENYYAVNETQTLICLNTQCIQTSTAAHKSSIKSGMSKIMKSLSAAFKSIPAFTLQECKAMIRVYVLQSWDSDMCKKKGKSLLKS